MLFSEKYNVNILTEELPSSLCGFYTIVDGIGYIVINSKENTEKMRFYANAILFYHLIKKTPNFLFKTLTTAIEKEAIQFAEDRMSKGEYNELIWGLFKGSKNCHIP